MLAPARVSQMRLETIPHMAPAAKRLYIGAGPFSWCSCAINGLYRPRRNAHLLPSRNMDVLSPLCRPPIPSARSV